MSAPVTLSRKDFDAVDIIVRISSNLLRVSAVSDYVPEIQVSCRGQLLTLRPGESVEFELLPA